MPSSFKEHANSAAAISLVVLCACIACLIPPLNEKVVGNPALIVLVGLGIACSGILHLVFVGLLARSYGESPGKYVALAILTLPVGSVVGLILLEWYERPDKAGQASAA